MERHLAWDGCFNARDLGGFRTEDGRTTRWRQVIRSDALDRLTPAGWDTLLEYGVRTVIDLRNHDELARDATARPAELSTLHVPLDGVDDPAAERFWARWGTELHGTPLYYRPFLESFPHRVADVVTAVAEAPPGGVVVHCAVGRDRTGLMALVLLALVGVPAEEIADDHGLSTERLRTAFETLGVADQAQAITDVLAANGTTRHEAVIGTLAGLDVADYLRGGGASEATLRSVRDRLLGPDADPG